MNRFLLLGVLFIAPASIQEPDKSAFWSKIEEIRKAAKDNQIKYDTAERIYKSWKPADLDLFWKELVRLLEESYRWDIWAVGSILEGHLDVEFCLEFQLLILLQGREFHEAVLKDPRHIAKAFDSSTPSTRYDLSSLMSAALNIPSEEGRKNPQKERTDRDPAGVRWNWRELKKLHPDIWERYFVKRERRPPLPDLKSLKDGDLMWEANSPLMNWIDIYSEPEYYLEQIGTLSPAQRGLLAVVWMQSEVNNGGYDQFFINSTAVVAPEALGGLKLFGATEVGTSLGKLMAAFPGGAPSRERGKREKQMEERWGKKSVEVEFKVPWSDLSKLPAKIAAYIRANPDEFFTPAKK